MLRTLLISLTLLSATQLYADNQPAEPTPPAESTPSKTSTNTSNAENSEQSALLADMVALEYADESRCFLKNPDGSRAPVIHLLVAANSIEGVDSAQIYHALDVTLNERQCDIHVLDNAQLTALNAAILFNDAQMVRYLLEHKADPKRPIAFRSSIHGKNSFEFWAYLHERDKRNDRSAVGDALNEYR